MNRRENSVFMKQHPTTRPHHHQQSSPGFPTHLEGGEGVGGDVEGRHLHVIEETVEMVRMKDDLGERLVADALPQHDATVQRYLGCLVPTHTHTHTVTLVSPCPGATGLRGVRGCASHPLSSMKRTSWWEQKYSTVGLLVPICLLRMLLKI